MSKIKRDELSFRSITEEDMPTLASWVNDEKILKWCPMTNEPRELQDSLRVWTSYAKMGAGVTILYKGKPCGMANLYIQACKKLKHQCLFSMIVEESFRGRGIGGYLMDELFRVAKEKFNVEMMHLEVYEGNPAIYLYKKKGFVEYGKEPHFVKNSDGKYCAKIMMQRML
jgi:putative acetyltransferase